MSTLKTVLAQKIDAHRPRTTKLVKECGDVKLGDVTIAQAIGGARGVKCLSPISLISTPSKVSVSAA
jgi:citrate synthase